MMKFFRKHQKWILISMVALMVLFLVPQLFEGGMGGQNPTVARIVLNGETQTITFNDRAVNANNLEILAQVDSNYIRGTLSAYLGHAVYGGRLDADDGMTWYLWGRLVDLYDIHVTESERLRFFSNHGVTGTQRNDARDRTGRPLALVDAAFDQLIALEKLTLLMRDTALILPESRVREKVRDLNEKVWVDLVYPDLDKFSAMVARPNDAVLQETFEKYRSETQGAGPFDFGYRIPAKVRAEFLTLDASTLAERPDLLGISDVDAYRYYQAHLKDYTEKPAPKPTATSAADDTPESQPAVTSAPDDAPAPEPRQKSFAEVRREVLRAMANASAGPNEPTRAESFAENVLRDALRWIQNQPDPSKVVYFNLENPADPETVSGYIQNRWKVRLQPASTRLFSRDEASAVNVNLPDLVYGRSVGAGYRGPSALDRMFYVTPIVGAAAVPSQLGAPLAVNEQVDSVYRASDQLYIWRVVEAHADRPADGLDEVREQVIADVRKLDTFNRAEQAMQRLKREVVEEKIDLGRAMARVNGDLAEELKKIAATQPDVSTTQPEKPEAEADKPATTQPTTQPDKEKAEPTDFLNRTQIGVTRQELTVDQQLFQAIFQSQMQRGGDWSEAFQNAQRWAQVFRTPRPPLAPSPKTVEEAFDLAAKAKAKGLSEHPAALVVDREAGEAGVLAFMRFDRLVEATTVNYGDDRPEVLGRLQLDAEMKFQQEWYNPQELRKRLHFEDLESKDSKPQ